MAKDNNNNKYQQARENVKSMSDEKLQEYRDRLQGLNQEGVKIGSQDKYSKETASDALKAFQDEYKDRGLGEAPSDINEMQKQSQNGYSDIDETNIGVDDTDRENKSTQTKGNKANKANIETRDGAEAKKPTSMQKQPSQRTNIQQTGSEIDQKQTDVSQRQEKTTEQIQTEEKPDMERKKEIVDNLNQYAETNPELFESKEAYDNFFGTVGDEERSEAEQQIVDKYWEYYQDQKKEQSKKNTLYSKSADDLARGMSSGKYTMDQINDLKEQDPEKYQEVMEIKNEKEQYGSANSNISNDKDKNKGVNQTVEDKGFMGVLDQYGIKASDIFSKNTFNPREKYNEIVNNEENTKQKQAVDEAKNKLDELKSKKADLRDTIKERHPNLSKKAIDAIYRDEVEGINEQIRTQTDVVNTEVDAYNTAIKQAQSEYEAALKQNQLEQQRIKNNLSRFNTLYSLQQQYEKNKWNREQKYKKEWELFMRKNKWKQAQEMQTEKYKQQLEEGDIYSDDPAIRNKAIGNAVDKALEKFEGMPIETSKQEFVSKVAGKLEAGEDFGQAMTDVVYGTIKENPYYDSWVSDNLGLTGEGRTDQPPKTTTGDNTYYYNPKTQGYSKFTQDDDFAESMVKWGENYIGTSYSYGSKKIEDGQVDCSGLIANFGKEMGVVSEEEMVNKMNAASMYQESKKNNLTKNVENIEKGDLLFYENDKGKINHTAIVASNYKDGSVEIIDSSKGRGVSRRTINIKDGKANGYKIHGANSFIEARKTQQELKKHQATQDQVINEINNVIDFSSNTEKAKSRIKDRLEKNIKTGKKDLVKNSLETMYRNNLPSQVQKKVYQAENSITALNGLQDSIESYRAKGGDMSIFRGTWQEIKLKLGEIDNEELVRLSTRIKEYGDQFMRDKTGAVIGASEREQFNMMLPTLKESFGQALAKIEGLKDNMRTKSETFIQDGIQTKLTDSTYNYLYSDKSEADKEEDKNYISNYVKNKAKESPDVGGSGSNNTQNTQASSSNIEKQANQAIGIGDSDGEYANIDRSQYSIKSSSAEIEKIKQEDDDIVDRRATREQVLNNDNVDEFIKSKTKRDGIIADELRARIKSEGGNVSNMTDEELVDDFLNDAPKSVQDQYSYYMEQGNMDTKGYSNQYESKDKTNFFNNIGSKVGYLADRTWDVAQGTAASMKYAPFNITSGISDIVAKSTPFEFIDSFNAELQKFNNQIIEEDQRILEDIGVDTDSMSYKGGGLMGDVIMTAYGAGAAKKTKGATKLVNYIDDINNPALRNTLKGVSYSLGSATETTIGSLVGEGNAPTKQELGAGLVFDVGLDGVVKLGDSASNFLRTSDLIKPNKHSQVKKQLKAIDIYDEPGDFLAKNNVHGSRSAQASKLDKIFKDAGDTLEEGFKNADNIPASEVPASVYTTAEKIENQIKGRFGFDDAKETVEKIYMKDKLSLKDINDLQKHSGQLLSNYKIKGDRKSAMNAQENSQLYLNVKSFLEKKAKDQGLDIDVKELKKTRQVSKTLSDAIKDKEGTAGVRQLFAMFGPGALGGVAGASQGETLGDKVRNAGLGFAATTLLANPYSKSTMANMIDGITLKEADKTAKILKSGIVGTAASSVSDEEQEKQKEKMLQEEKEQDNNKGFLNRFFGK